MNLMLLDQKKEELLGDLTSWAKGSRFPSLSKSPHPAERERKRQQTERQTQRERDRQGERQRAPQALPVVYFSMFFMTLGRYQGSEIRDDPTKTKIPQKCALFLEEFRFPCLSVLG